MSRGAWLLIVSSRLCAFQAPVEPNTKTVGTQSDYRESEAQTLPWSPDYQPSKDAARQVRRGSALLTPLTPAQLAKLPTICVLVAVRLRG